MNRVLPAGLAVLSLVTVALFQNCSGYEAYNQNNESSLGSGAPPPVSHEEPHVMRASATEAPNVDIRFEAHGVLGSDLFLWSYTIDNAGSGCTERSANNATSYTINCTRGGALRVNLRLTRSGSTQTLSYSTTLNQPVVDSPIPLEVVFEIPAGTGSGSWNTAATQIETFIGQTLKIRNMDSITHQLHTNGRPCPHGNAIPAGGMADCVISQSYNRTANGANYDHIAGTAANVFMVAYDGPAMYATNCQSCHGPLATSSKKGMTLSRFESSIRNVSAHQVPAIMNLTLRQRQALVHALR